MSLLHDYSVDPGDVETPEDRMPVCIGCGWWKPTCGPYCADCVEDEG